MNDCDVGIDLGGTTIRAGVVDAEGRSRGHVILDTEAKAGYAHVVARLAEAAHRAADQAGLDLSEVAGVGVGSPGVLDSTTGVVHTSPNLPGFDEVPLASDLADALGHGVTVENDANAAAWGEFWVGAGRDVRSIVMLTLGTGVGGGIVLDGHLWRGAHDAGAEIGHMIIKEGGRRCGCGRSGCLEAYASVTGMVGRLVEAVETGEPSSLEAMIQEGKTLTGRDVHDAAVAGDCLAARIMAETAHYLGVGIVNICHLLNPDRVILTGGMTAAGDRLMGPVRRTVREMAFAVPAERTEIVVAALGEDAGYIGAAGLARLARSSAAGAAQPATHGQ